MNSNVLENYLVNISFGLLMLALIIYWLSITFANLVNTYKVGQIIIIITNIFLASSLLLRWITNNYFPLSNLYESLIFLSWSLTLIHIILEKQNNNKLIGAISIPITLFIIAFASLSLPTEMRTASPLVPALRSNWLMMHVTIMIISYATLIIGSLLSILFLIIAKGENIEIKGSSLNYISKEFTINSCNSTLKTNTNNYRLNLLETIDHLSYRIIGFGFPLLTIGIIAGAVWANEAWGSYWSWDPKETWALVTWLIFASYLHTRFTKSWRGKKPAILASLGFLIVWICYLGVNFIGKGLHTYGWLI
uniref:Cytochrome c biogenesis protein CcsA n=1 Tax=Sporolithon durum TaxID=48970 RepID=A0A141SCX5_9FLOR|nr:cytochrome c biogenesis protein [Sporolithon durum]AMK96143.1 cytochrome c biogenesis protein [Sporolithon durum]